MCTSLHVLHVNLCTHIYVYTLTYVFILTYMYTCTHIYAHTLYTYIDVFSHICTPMLMKIPTTDLRARERSGDVTTHKWVYRTRTGACSNSREPNVNQGRQGHGQVDPGPLAA